MKVAVYCRVSTTHQTVENQLQDLRVVADKMGSKIVAELTDGISGAKGKDQRPAFAELMRRATLKEFDIIMVPSLCSVGRSVRDLVDFFEQLKSCRIDFYCHSQTIDTSTESGRMVFSIFSAISEYEKEITRERIMSGLSRAKAQGVRLGRPGNMNDSVRTSVRLLKERGMGVKQISRELKIGVGSVYKALAA